MIYIDTHSKDSMTQSLCSYYSTTKEHFSNLLSYFAIQYKLRNYNVEIINQFIDVLRSHEQRKIESVLFYHLSRRLDAGDTSNNLFDLLLSTNTFSDFLKEHSIIASSEEQKILLFYKEKEIRFDGDSSLDCYFRWRLGRTQREPDYCVNGFLLRDTLEKNNYFLELNDAPEFITNLSDYLKTDSILQDYHSRSKYYCFEYLLPVDRIIIDGKETLSASEKTDYILESIIKKLLDYEISPPQFIYDHDNPILRLNDNDSILSSFLKKKELIEIK